MPTYEFKCLGCAHVVQDNLRVEDRDAAKTCPQCKSPMIRKWGVAAVVIR